MVGRRGPGRREHRPVEYLARRRAAAAEAPGAGLAGTHSQNDGFTPTDGAFINGLRPTRSPLFWVADRPFR
jgi:hypothetical protein